MLFFRLPKLSPVLVSAVRSRRLTKNAPLAKELIAATTPRKWEEYQPVEVRKPAGKRIFLTRLEFVPSELASSYFTFNTYVII